MDTMGEAHMWAVDKPLHPSLARTSLKVSMENSVTGLRMAISLAVKLGSTRHLTQSMF